MADKCQIACGVVCCCLVLAFFMACGGIILYLSIALSNTSKSTKAPIRAATLPSSSSNSENTKWEPGKTTVEPTKSSSTKSKKFTCKAIYNDVYAAIAECVSKSYTIAFSDWLRHILITRS